MAGKFPIEDIYNKDLIPVTVKLKNTDPATASNYGKFFIALRAYEVVEVAEVHGAAATSGSPVTLNIERLQGTEALGSGDNILVTPFDLKGTINTVVTRKGYNGELQNRKLNIGDRLALKDSGATGNIADLVVTLLLKPLGKGDYR